MSVFSGLRGDATTAFGYLRTAFDNRPVVDARPLPTEYQWTELCDWLFDATGDVRYRDMALEWSRNYERISPYASWA
jgi:hypothetical protein